MAQCSVLHRKNYYFASAVSVSCSQAKTKHCAIEVPFVFAPLEIQLVPFQTYWGLLDDKSSGPALKICFVFPSLANQPCCSAVGESTKYKVRCFVPRPFWRHGKIHKTYETKWKARGKVPLCRQNHLETFSTNSRWATKVAKYSFLLVSLKHSYEERRQTKSRSTISTVDNSDYLLCVIVGVGDGPENGMTNLPLSLPR